MFFILDLFSIGVLGIARDPGLELPPLTRGANFSPRDKLESALEKVGRIFLPAIFKFQKNFEIL